MFNRNDIFENDCNDGIQREYCDAFAPNYKCFLSTSAQRYLWFHSDNSQSQADGFCPAPTPMQTYDKKSLETLLEVWHVLWTIMPVLFFFAIARITTQMWQSTARSDSTKRFAVEFVIIALPSVMCVNIANTAVEYIVAVMIIFLLLLVWHTQCLEKARLREFYLGRRPCMLTLARATINFLTALCILAIDFESFPKSFRKSRRFGAGLMDVGIGLFVFSMGTVSRRPKRATDIVRLIRMVTPVLFLGLARTVLIMAIDYHQDEHEYGVHLNAFFTLGLTKLFGTLVSVAARADWMLLPLGLGILAMHETILQLGISDYVMDKHVRRTNFLSANREGLLSLPGFIGIYIISMYIGQWLQTKDSLNFKEFSLRLKLMSIINACIWLIVLVCIFIFGIARVTCNFGYAAWILSIAFTMTTLFMIVFDLILNTLWPIELNNEICAEISADTVRNGGKGDPSGECLINVATKSVDSYPNQLKFQIPTLVEAINLNGLTFFLLSNVLTGGVNIFLEPEDRSDLESVFILTLYMLTAIGAVYVMYRFKLRIA